MFYQLKIPYWKNNIFLILCLYQTPYYWMSTRWPASELDYGKSELRRKWNHHLFTHTLFRKAFLCIKEYEILTFQKVCFIYIFIYMCFSNLPGQEEHQKTRRVNHVWKGMWLNAKPHHSLWRLYNVNLLFISLSS